MSRSERERGQVLLLMALTIVGLLAAVGLAIDGGTVFVERRRMQNAADAAALAGTHELARHIGTQDPDEAIVDGLIAAQVRAYAADNGVVDPQENVVAEYVVADGNGDAVSASPRHLVGGGSIPHGALGISTTVGIERETTFIRVIGIETAGAAAHAVGVVGPRIPHPMTSDMVPGGVLPIAYPVDKAAELEDGESFCFADDNPVLEDGIPANRGWVHLSCVYNYQDPPGIRTPDCSASNAKIKGWIDQSNPFTDPLYCGAEGINKLEGDWIVGDPGSRQSSRHSLKELGQDNPGVVYYIPLYDKAYDRHQMRDEFGNPGNLFKGNDLWFRLVAFAGIKIHGTTQNVCEQNKHVSGELVKIVYTLSEPDVTEDYGWGSEGAAKEKSLSITLHR